MALKRLLARLTPLDRLLVAGLLLACLAGLLRVGAAAPGVWVVAERDGEILFRARLAADQSLELPGPLGLTEVRISGGRARVVASPCRDKVCIGMGAIRRAGEFVACLPNRVLLTIPGARTASEEYDVLSR